MSNERQETVADIVAEMRKDIAEGTVGIWSDFGGEIARSYADCIEAAWKREREATTEKSSAVGNAAAMREALEDARRFVSASAQRTDRDLLIMDEKRGAYVLTPKDTLIKIDDVLSAPPRNCDRFATFDDARNTFFADYMLDETRSSASAFAIWLFDKAKGEADEQK